jgi:hypothetical protein
LARLGLVGRINPVGRALEQKPHQCVGGLEDGGADQHFQFLDASSVGFLTLKLRHQLVDFLVLGQEEMGGGIVFFEPAARSDRVRSTMSWAYWSTSD